MNYVKSHSGNEYPRDPNTFIKHVDLINRCFYPNSVEEITDLLRREASPFAQHCLAKMQTNSQLSMKLALRLLREARTLDYKGALQNELKVSLNKLEDKDFDLGVSEILLKPRGGMADFVQNVSEDQVKSYFQDNKWVEKIQLDVVEKALLPTRFYYQKYTDHVRLWINESTTTQTDIRENFDYELNEGLKSVGIDIRDRALTIESARAQLYQQESQTRLQQHFEDRLTALVKDPMLRDRYFGDLRSHVEHLAAPENSAEFYLKINKHIQDIFEQAYL